MKPIFSNTCKITDYKPVYKLGNSYAICFNCVPLKAEKYQGKYAKYSKNIEHVSTDLVMYNYMVFDLMPSITEIKAEYEEYVNSIVSTMITNFYYDDKQFNLSKENQMNYKAAYDLAVQTNGANLPYKVKCKAGIKQQYLIFNDVNEFTSFYVAINKHINSCLERGWNMKDSIDYSVYVQ